ncbi:MAG: transferase [Gallionella sp.]
MRLKNKQLKNIAKSMQQQAKNILSWTNEARHNKPYLTEKKGILALNFDALSIQSEMRIDLPDELVIAYTRLMMSFLLLAPSPNRIAMIGLGGGSMAKYCYRHLPRSKIIIIEINPDVIALRNEFEIPADDNRFQILPGNGAEWVSNNNQVDILIADGFDTDGLPAQLSSQQFYDDCFNALSEKGIMVANLWGGYPNYEDYLERIQNSFSGHVIVVDTDDSVNKIILAVKDAAFPPSRLMIRKNANTLSLSHPLNFQAKSNKLIRALGEAN